MGKISPLDIRNQTFRTVFRGADNEEVRLFLELVATEFENLLSEHTRLTERLRYCEDRLADYGDMEKTLRDGVLTAQRMMDEAHDSSRRDAETIVHDAERRGSLILEDARNRMGRLVEEIRALQTKRDVYLEQMRGFLLTHLDLLERNEHHLEALDAVSEEAEVTLSRARRADPRPQSAPPPPAPQPGPTRAEEVGTPSSQPPGWPAASTPRARGFGRGQPPVANPGRDARAPQGETGWAQAEQDPRRPIPEPRVAPPGGGERSEGLFTISADDEDPASGGR